MRASSPLLRATAGQRAAKPLRLVNSHSSSGRALRLQVRAVAEPPTTTHADAPTRAAVAGLGATAPVTGGGLPIHNGAALPALTPAAAPAPAPAAAAGFVPGVVPPAAVFGRVVDGGAAKAELPWAKILIMGAMAGFYIGFGGLLSVVVGGNCPGARSWACNVWGQLGGAEGKLGCCLGWGAKGGRRAAGRGRCSRAAVARGGGRLAPRAVAGRDRPSPPPPHHPPPAPRRPSATRRHPLDPLSHLCPPPSTRQHRPRRRQPRPPQDGPRRVRPPRRPHARADLRRGALHRQHRVRGGGRARGAPARVCLCVRARAGGGGKRGGKARRRRRRRVLFPPPPLLTPRLHRRPSLPPPLLRPKQGRATKRQLAKSWLCSYLGNALGCAAFVAAIAASGVVAGAAAPQAAAVAKTSLPWGVAFVRGVLCNIFVCLSIWQATAATTLTGKFVGAWLPVSAFAAIGFEHSIANLFFVPLGIARELLLLLFLVAPPAPSCSRAARWRVDASPAPLVRSPCPLANKQTSPLSHPHATNKQSARPSRCRRSSPPT